MMPNTNGWEQVLVCRFGWLGMAVLLMTIPILLNNLALSSRIDEIMDLQHGLPETILQTTDTGTYCKAESNQPLAKYIHTQNPLDVPVIDPRRDVQVKDVVCEYDGRAADTHFPHALQQLYRCYSFWQDYPTKQALLLIPDSKVEKKLESDSFTNGMMKMFEFQMNMEILIMDLIFPEDLENGTMIEKPDMTLKRVQRMPNYGIRHVEYLHYYMENQFNLTDNSRDTCQHDKPRIAILNREYNATMNSTRTLLNAQQIVNQTSHLSRKDQIPIQYFERLDFAQQVAFFRSVDILISPHGAQLTGVALMNAPCSHVVELFPKGYAIPEFFGSLAIESGKEYSYLYMSRNAPEIEQAATPEQRSQARRANFCPSANVMEETIRQLVEEWRQCCSAREAIARMRKEQLAAL